MTRETAEHVAELAALLAQHPYTAPPFPGGERSRTLDPCPSHVAAREAVELCKLAKRAHRFAERQCNENIPESTIDRTHDRITAKVNEVLDRFGLVGAIQWDPRGWPVAILDSPEHAESWERCGSPRELLRVTPHA